MGSTKDSAGISASSDTEQRLCAGGCGFAATWQPTHCCMKCKLGGGKHGPKCEQLTVAPRSGEESQTGDGKLPAGGKDKGCSKGQVLALLLKGKSKGCCKGHLLGKGSKSTQETTAARDPELAPTLGADS